MLIVIVFRENVRFLIYQISYIIITNNAKYLTDCSTGRCQCKENVEGRQCDRCRAGFFGLLPNNPSGCSSCW